MSVINLLKKDWLSYRKTMVWALAYLVLFGISFQSFMGQGAYVLTITLAVYIAAIGSIQYDEKNRIDNFLGILPLRRSAVIAEKFLLADLFFLIGILVYAVLAWINLALLDAILYPVPEPLGIALSFLCVSVMNLISIPISYKYGSNRGRIMAALISAMIFAGVVIGVGTAGGLIGGRLPNSGLLIGVFLLLGALCQWAGFRIACSIYQKRDI
ncbi:ABC-2 transporter permease [Ructibacterium gallinarum]|uniref:ABC-2 transporter permease n=1 Tax=Ructibacterium gallinarum TaxID=2779355 RepID=A0A9D5R8W7_9FIRM|nr:ABC-2 transporter permease [Ructibacterium gallinarum]MBE5040435.1 ABC-2 transporter permease [Ructibacterium gallinarum]